MVTIRPDLMGSAETFPRNVTAFAEAVRSARPLPGAPPVRMPFDRSRQERQKRLAAGAIELPDALVSELIRLSRVHPAQPPTSPR